MELLLKLIGLAWLANLITWAAYPAQRVKAWFSLGEDDWKPGSHWVFKWAIQLWNCPKCLGFWLGLGWASYWGYSQVNAVVFAALVSGLAMLGEFAKALPVPQNK
jgi:hypothetical protein